MRPAILYITLSYQGYAMKILVCVKQVPDTSVPINIDGSGPWVIFNGRASTRMNRFDEYAVEQALIIKEQIGDATVDAMTVGPEECSTVVRRALGMGADHGIHILTENENYVSPLNTASRMALAARDRKYDLILTGVMSEDMTQGLVGPMVAEMLSLQCSTSCVLVTVDPERATVYVERDVEGGRRQALELEFPAVITVQSGINKPRYPSLSNIMRANKQELEVISAAAREMPLPCENLLSLAYPQKSRAGLLLEGCRKDKARQLLHILRERSLLA